MISNRPSTALPPRPAVGTGRRRGPGLVFLLALVGLCAACLFGGAKPASADYWHHGVIQGADVVDLNHLGSHTHQNKIKFNLRRLYMRNPNPRSIEVTAHCQLWTWVPKWGTIEQWTILPEGDYAVVTAPTRFADLTYVSATGGYYYENWPYYADVWWYGP